MKIYKFSRAAKPIANPKNRDFSYFVMYFTRSRLKFYFQKFGGTDYTKSPSWGSPR